MIKSGSLRHLSDDATSNDAAEGVDRLKELLFDNEAQTLSELEQRLRSVEGSAKHYGHHVDELFRRAGTEERFRSSVAVVLDKALQEAELRDHAGLSRALAPSVVSTIKTELKNSQDDLVEIMFPITGRMVKSYISAEMKKLASSVNRRIDSNPVMLRLRSLASGKRVTDLAIAEGQRLSVDEIFLIRRGSGELFARWPLGRSELSNSDIHMSGVLDAINDFASSAFADDGGHFDSFRYDDFQVYMRASPVYLLAAKCSGIAPSGIEEILDEAFLETMERVSALERASEAGGREMTPQARSLELHPFTEKVEGRTGEIYDELAGTKVGGTIVKALLFFIVVPLLAWFFWGLYTDAEERMTRHAAQSVIDSNKALEGYQTNLSVGYRGRSITVRGLAPNEQTLAAFSQALKSELPNVEINTRMAAIPPKHTELIRERIIPAPAPAPIIKKPIIQTVDTAALEARLAQQVALVENALMAAGARRAVRRAADRLNQALPEMDRLAGFVKGGQQRDDLKKAKAELRRTLGDVVRVGQRIEKEGSGSDALQKHVASINKLTGVVSGTIESVTSLHAGGGVKRRAGFAKPAAKTLGEAADDLASQAERIATLVLALNKAAAMIPPPVVIPEPSAEDRLRGFAERNAVFFSSETEFASQSLASDVFDEMARLIKETTNVIRVIGYTDPTGRAESNEVLAQSRAEVVADELVRRGVPRSRVVAVGRSGWFYLSRTAGETSANRRVQFEIGFRSEVHVPQ